MIQTGKKLNSPKQEQIVIPSQCDSYEHGVRAILITFEWQVVQRVINIQSAHLSQI